MSKRDGEENHLQAAFANIQIVLVGAVISIAHIFLGFSQWTKNRHIVIQAGITAGISVMLLKGVNIIVQFFFTTFWEQAVYVSGLRLRLLPVPLSIVIYGMFIFFLLLGLSLDSSIRDLRSDIDEIKEGRDIGEEDESG